jgi:hypothetical protein
VKKIILTAAGASAATLVAVCALEYATGVPVALLILLSIAYLFGWRMC